MIGRHYLLEIKRVKELALPTLLPPHHGSLPRFVVSFRRNHGSSPVSTRVLQHIPGQSGRHLLGLSFTESAPLLPLADKFCCDAIRRAFTSTTAFHTVLIWHGRLG